MRMATGTVTATSTNQYISVSDIGFTPDIVIVRLISPILDDTTASSLLWIYTKYGTASIGTDSSGFKYGIASTISYADQGRGIYKGCISVSENSFGFSPASELYRPIISGSTFEWTAIKYTE